MSAGNGNCLNYCIGNDNHNCVAHCFGDNDKHCLTYCQGNNHPHCLTNCRAISGALVADARGQPFGWARDPRTADSMLMATMRTTSAMVIRPLY